MVKVVHQAGGAAISMMPTMILLMIVTYGKVNQMYRFND